MSNASSFHIDIHMNFLSLWLKMSIRSNMNTCISQCFIISYLCVLLNKSTMGIKTDEQHENKGEIKGLISGDSFRVVFIFHFWTHIGNGNIKTRKKLSTWLQRTAIAYSGNWGMNAGKMLWGKWYSGFSSFEKYVMSLNQGSTVFLEGVQECEDTLNLHNVICQSYLNKSGGEKECAGATCFNCQPVIWPWGSPGIALDFSLLTYKQKDRI